MRCIVSDDLGDGFKNHRQEYFHKLVRLRMIVICWLARECCCDWFHSYTDRWLPARRLLRRLRNCRHRPRYRTQHCGLPMLVNIQIAAAPIKRMAAEPLILSPARAPQRAEHRFRLKDDPVALNLGPHHPAFPMRDGLPRKLLMPAKDRQCHRRIAHREQEPARKGMRDRRCHLRLKSSHSR